MPEPLRRPSDSGSALELAPGVARLALGAAWRTARWGVGAYLQAGERIMRAAGTGEGATELLQDAGAELREYAHRLLDLADHSHEPGHTPPGPEHPAASARHPSRRGGHEPNLQARGAELLRRSADVHYEEAAHPAYARILDELAPDEARILRMMRERGPQPAVDVRGAKNPLGLSAHTVAQGISMIGPQAGVRYLERVPAYLNNLYRLGLVWFSREPLEDHMEYQVLEAQPEVAAAIKSAGRGRTLRRSIVLTPFGEDFCAACLPVDVVEAPVHTTTSSTTVLTAPAADQPKNPSPRPV
ncbi:MAG TPA: Abi-alpha family protein [Solirubrobacteraceae bacterium]|nr:Abi-alpha family protein [Solirubrobacteraceae bacterium]